MLCFHTTLPSHGTAEVCHSQISLWNGVGMGGIHPMVRCGEAGLEMEGFLPRCHQERWFPQQEAHVFTAVLSSIFCSENKGDKITRITRMGVTTDTCLGLIQEENHLKDRNYWGERTISWKTEVKASRVGFVARLEVAGNYRHDGYPAPRKILLCQASGELWPQNRCPDTML